MNGSCAICPRKCGADRTSAPGMCGGGNSLRVARAALHFWEEPVLVGCGGSGAVFFSGCAMKCVYCQNRRISSGCFGKDITPERLREIYLELIDEGAVNINLVTPTHFTDLIIPTLEEKLPVPVVWNTSAYENVGTLRRLEGKVQIYLPDLKYMSADLAARYSAAPDYPETAVKAIKEMYRQVGPPVIDDDGIMRKGVIIRHLMLPGQLGNTLDVIDRVTEEFSPGEVLFSLMNQYTPMPDCPLPELARRVTPEEYAGAVDYLYLSGIEDGFLQEDISAKEEFIPDFDLTGV